MASTGALLAATFLAVLQGIIPVRGNHEIQSRDCAGFPSVSCALPDTSFLSMPWHIAPLRTNFDIHRNSNRKRTVACVGSTGPGEGEEKGGARRFFRLHELPGTVTHDRGEFGPCPTRRLVALPSGWASFTTNSARTEDPVRALLATIAQVERYKRRSRRTCGTRVTNVTPLGPHPARCPTCLCRRLRLGRRPAPDPSYAPGWERHPAQCPT